MSSTDQPIRLFVGTLTGQGLALFAEYCRGWILKLFFLVDGRNPATKRSTLWICTPGKLANMDPKNDGLEEDVSF